VAYEWKHPQQKEVYFWPFRINLNNFQEPALIPIVKNKMANVQEGGELNNLKLFENLKV